MHCVVASTHHTEYKPDGASEMLPVKKDVRLYRLPECLVLHLKRFTYRYVMQGAEGGVGSGLGLDLSLSHYGSIETLRLFGHSA